jgi:hypothetical protein
VDWNTWLCAVEPTLRAGHEAIVPHDLPHPSDVGFTRPFIAEPHGQKDDWVYPLGDGSRLHVHEFAHVMVAHLDPHDPSKGPGTAFLHWTTESASGRMFLVTSGLWLLIKLLK